MIRIVIQGNPTTKKNSQKIVYSKSQKRSFIVQGDKYQQYERDAGYQITYKGLKLKGPLEVTCVFYRDSKRRCDLTNLLEAVDDILVKYGVIEDDDFKTIASHDGSRVYIDKDNPRTEITIKEFK